MLKYTLGRIGRACITIFLVLSIVFLLMRLMPVETFFEGRSDTMSDTVKENILRQLGLLDPWYIELPRFWTKLLLHGDMGESIVMRVGVPVGKVIWPKAKVSFEAVLTERRPIMRSVSSRRFLSESRNLKRRYLRRAESVVFSVMLRMPKMPVARRSSVRKAKPLEIASMTRYSR